MYHVMFYRGAQNLSASEESEDRDLVRLSHGYGLDSRGSAHKKSQSKHVVLLDQLVDAVNGHVRLVPIIVGDQLDLAAVHAALFVHHVHIDLGP